MKVTDMNTQKLFTVRGKVVLEEEQKGILGLKILLYDKDHFFDDKLGVAYTDQEGNFTIQYREEDFQDLFERAPDLYLKIVDFQYQTIHSTENAVRVNAGLVSEFNIALPRSKVGNHAKTVRPLKRLSGGIVDREKLDIIDQAVEKLASYEAENYPGMVPFSAELPSRVRGPISGGAAYCPAPGILNYGDIVDTAREAIAGDPDEIERFIDMVDTIVYHHEVRQPEKMKEVQDSWLQRETPNPKTFYRVLTQKQKFLRQAPIDSLIEADRIVPVLCAAVLVAGDNITLKNKYLSVLCGEVKALNQMDVVYRRALDALHSNPSGYGPFGNLLRDVGRTCGPDDGPIRYPLPPEPEILQTEPMWKVVLGAYTAAIEEAIRESRTRPDYEYKIEDIDWGDGCPGSRVIITGRNFGSGSIPADPSLRNRVDFRHQSGDDSVSADIISWTDTRIEVRIPDEAGPGPIHLVIWDPITTGNLSWGVGRSNGGEVFSFTGGTAYIRSLTVRDSTGIVRSPYRVDPGETITLEWEVVPADATVDLVVTQNGSVLIPKQSVMVIGNRTINIPAGGPSQTICILTVDNRCSTAIHERLVTIYGCINPNLSIDGIEVSQAIQYYKSANHLADVQVQGVSQGVPAVDNSVPLVIGKPAYVRVYLRSGLPLAYKSGELPDVTGTLRVERLTGAGRATLLDTLSPISSITAQATYLSYDNERGNINASLNFIIPAWLMYGHLRLTVDVNSPEGGCRGCASSEITVNVLLQQTLQVAGILVSYNGPPALNSPAGTPNLVLPAPTLGDLQSTAAFTLATYPVQSDSVFTFRVAGTFTQKVPLQDPVLPPGQGCSNNWNQLMIDLQDIAILDGNQYGWIYYGLLANGIPIGPVTGCGGSGVGVGERGDSVTMAHEVGHALGLEHAPCGNPGNPDPNYPAYEPYDPNNTPQASIGEYGIGGHRGPIEIYRPDVTKDFMSYCAPAWISPYHYSKLTNLDALSPINLSFGSAGIELVNPRKAMETQPLINLLGFINPGDEVSIHSISRSMTRSHIVGGTLTDLFVELLDADENVISAAPVYKINLEVPGQADLCTVGVCSCMIQALLPNVGRGSVLRIRRGPEVLWHRRAPATPVSVREVRASIDNNGQLNIGWVAQTSETIEPRASIRWSNNQGATWHGLTVGLKGQSAILDVSTLPGGETLFEVMVHDGFDTASAVAESVFIPHKPPLAAILAPGDGVKILAGSTLRLWGAGTALGSGKLRDDACQWLLDGQMIATGQDIFIAAPSVGEHRITLRVADNYGSAEKTHRLTVIEPPTQD